MYSFIDHNKLTINQDFLDVLTRSRLDDFCLLKNYKGGGLLKKNKYRSVARIVVTEGQSQKVFYLKRHFWPLKERIKYLVPWSSAEDAGNEWNNMIDLEKCGFHTMVPVAFGEEKRFGIPYCSLTLTESIDNAEKLETYCPARFTPPLRAKQVREKRVMIGKLAALAGDLHRRGLNHQDFYLGHILIRQDEDKLFIIDVQRMHKNTTISLHDKIKDLAQLAYSARRLGVFTNTDLLRFFHFYTGSDILKPDHKKLAKSIMLKTKKISKHDANIQSRKKRLRAK